MSEDKSWNAEDDKTMGRGLNRLTVVQICLHFIHPSNPLKITPMLTFCSHPSRLPQSRSVPPSGRWGPPDRGSRRRHGWTTGQSTCTVQAGSPVGPRPLPVWIGTETPANRLCAGPLPAWIRTETPANQDTIHISRVASHYTVHVCTATGRNRHQRLCAGPLPAWIRTETPAHQGDNDNNKRVFMVSCLARDQSAFKDIRMCSFHHHTHPHTHPPMHTHPPTCTHTNKYTHTLTHTHTHTHTNSLSHTHTLPLSKTPASRRRQQRRISMNWLTFCTTQLWKRAESGMTSSRLGDTMGSSSEKMARNWVMMSNRWTRLASIVLVMWVYAVAEKETTDMVCQVTQHHVRKMGKLCCLCLFSTPPPPPPPPIHSKWTTSSKTGVNT